MMLCTWATQLDDLYGSPTLDEVEAFSREFYKGLEAALGAEGAGKLSIEISSPVCSQFFPENKVFPGVSGAQLSLNSGRFFLQCASMGWLLDARGTLTEYRRVLMSV